MSTINSRRLPGQPWHPRNSAYVEPGAYQKAGFITLRLREDWLAIRASVAKQIEAIVHRTSGGVLVVLDNASDLHVEARMLQGTLSEIQPDWPVVLVMGEQPDRWQYVCREVPYARGIAESSLVRVHQLLPSECNALVDRILTYEAEGTLTKQPRALTRDERLQLCVGEADRHFLVAMMQMRHGGRFGELIRTEFDRVPTAEAQEAYGAVCLFNDYGVSIPESVALEAFGATTASAIQALRDATTGLLVSDQIGLRARHSRIAHVAGRYAFRDPHAIKAVLVRVLAKVDDTTEANRLFFEAFFTRHGIHRRIVRDLRRDVALVRGFFAGIHDTLDSFPQVYRRVSLSFQAMAERQLGEPAEARRRLQEAMAMLPPYAFAYRQKAWLEHSEGKWETAASDAMEAVRVAPHDFLCQFHCARILMFNTVENFRKAEEYLRRALEMGGEESLGDFPERYRRACKVLDFLVGLREGGILPEAALRELRPGLAFLRSYHGTRARQTRDALGRKLQAMEEDTSGATEDLDTLLAGVDWRCDVRLQASVACNTARLLYLDWYRNNADHSPDDIEGLFKESIRLNPEDPFAYCWYGTFLKEVRRDLRGSFARYRTAVRIGNRAKWERLHMHPLFLNNIALLRIAEVEAGLRKPDCLLGVFLLLLRAVSRIDELQSDFYWPLHSLSLCQQLMQERGLQAPAAHLEVALKGRRWESSAGSAVEDLADSS